MKISRRMNVDEVARNLPLLLNELTRKNEGIFVEKDGRLYRLEPVEINTADPEDLWANCDPETLRGAFKTAAGPLDGMDPDEVLAYIYKAREEGSKPADQS